MIGVIKVVTSNGLNYPLLGLAISTLIALGGAVYKVGKWVGSITSTVGNLADKVDAITVEIKSKNGATIADTVDKVADKMGVSTNG